MSAPTGSGRKAKLRAPVKITSAYTPGTYASIRAVANGARKFAVQPFGADFGSTDSRAAFNAPQTISMSAISYSVRLGLELQLLTVVGMTIAHRRSRPSGAPCSTTSQPAGVDALVQEHQTIMDLLEAGDSDGLQRAVSHHMPKAVDDLITTHPE